MERRGKERYRRRGEERQENRRRREAETEKEKTEWMERRVDFHNQLACSPPHLRSADSSLHISSLSIPPPSYHFPPDFCSPFLSTSLVSFPLASSHLISSSLPSFPLLLCFLIFVQAWSPSKTKQKTRYKYIYFLTK